MTHRGYYALSAAGVPYQKGWSAYFADHEALCPYPVYAMDYGFWRQGYADARRHDRVARRALRRAGDYAAWPVRRRG